MTLGSLVVFGVDITFQHEYLQQLRSFLTYVFLAYVFLAYVFLAYVFLAYVFLAYVATAAA
jgi:hypothetical protein